MTIGARDRDGRPPRDQARPSAAPVATASEARPPPRAARAGLIGRCGEDRREVGRVLLVVRDGLVEEERWWSACFSQRLSGTTVR